MAAKVRSKQRHLASTGPSLLQFTSTRTAADKALKEAETACEAALQVSAGALLLPSPAVPAVPVCILSTGSSNAARADANKNDHRVDAFQVMMS